MVNKERNEFINNRKNFREIGKLVYLEKERETHI